MKIPRRGLLPRPAYVRDAGLFVIAAEGEKTEAQYFALFNTERVRVEVLPTGPDGFSAPKHVLERLVKFQGQHALEDSDELWLVVDVDRQRPQFLDEVTRDAQASGYHVAVSHPCFELWLLLHFRDADPSDADCGAVTARLRQHLGGYSKTGLKRDLFTPEGIRAAIARAKTLSAEEEWRWPAFPGTHVYKLVEKLLPYLKP